MNITRNQDPHFWEKPHWGCNCGSFALNLTHWYDPYDDFYERLEFIRTWVEEGWTHDEILKILVETDRDFLLNNFDELNEISYADVLRADPSKRLIAYRISVTYDDWAETLEDFDCDFHFKVRIDGQWYEKNGTHAIHECELEPDSVWSYDGDGIDEYISLYYDSPIKFFELAPTA